MLQPWLQTNETAHAYAQNGSKSVLTFVGVYLTRGTRGGVTQVELLCWWNAWWSTSVRMNFTDEESAFIVKHYYWTMSYRRVRNAFEIEYPEWSVPNKSTVMRLTKTIEERGSVCRRQYHRDKSVLQYAAARHCVPTKWRRTFRTCFIMYLFPNSLLHMYCFFFRYVGCNIRGSLCSIDGRLTKIPDI